MDSNIINNFKDTVVQIATPYATGTGFYISDYHIIVTNRHVIEPGSDIVINTRKLKKRLATLLYSDALYDLAFLQVPEDWSMPQSFLSADAPKEAETIIAIGHPYGLKYTATQGIISKSSRLYKNVNYIQIDAAINPGNSGGPLINEKGEIIGVNTFIIADGENLGFALPVQYVKDSWNDYQSYFPQRAIRCASCSNIITDTTRDGSYCGNCGNKFDEKEFSIQTFKPAGICEKIENILQKLDKDVALSRGGTNNWEIEQGSAKIKIQYNQQSHFIIGDSFLCKLPKTNIAPVYEFLLRENYDIEGVYFATSEQDIVLSLLIYDEDLTPDTGFTLFKNLLEKADYYDDILIHQYAAQPIDEED